jgi:hypothetical protein
VFISVARRLNDRKRFEQERTAATVMQSGIILYLSFIYLFSNVFYLAIRAAPDRYEFLRLRNAAVIVQGGEDFLLFFFLFSPSPLLLFLISEHY